MRGAFPLSGYASPSHGGNVVLKRLFSADFPSLFLPRSPRILRFRVPPPPSLIYTSLSVGTDLPPRSKPYCTEHPFLVRFFLRGAHLLSRSGPALFSVKWIHRAVKESGTCVFPGPPLCYSLPRESKPVPTSKDLPLFPRVIASPTSRLALPTPFLSASFPPSARDEPSDLPEDTCSAKLH